MAEAGFPIRHIFRHPVKGMAADELERAWLQAGHGIPFDRAFAFLFKDADSTPGAARESYPWASKRRFAVQHDWPALSGIRCELDSRGRLTLIAPGHVPVFGDLRVEAERRELARFVTSFLASGKPSAPAAHPAATELELVGSADGSTRYPDRGEHNISVLNLASLRELEAAAGVSLDVRRFRGNLVIDGAEPWAELSWVGRTLTAGQARIEVRSPIGRCHNINVDPDSSLDDVQLLGKLREKFGHTKFGVMGVVESGGDVAVGDLLQIE